MTEEEAFNVRDGSAIRRFFSAKDNRLSMALGVFVFIFCVTAYWYLYLDARGGSGSFITIALLSGPLLLLGSWLLRTKLEHDEHHWMMVANEIALLLCALVIAIDWYKNPDNGVLEPLLIIVGFSIALAHGCQKLHVNLSKPKDEDSKG